MRHVLLLIAMVVTANGCELLSSGTSDRENEDVRPIGVVDRYVTTTFGGVHEHIAYAEAGSATVWERDVRGLSGVSERLLIARGDDGHWWLRPEDATRPTRWYRVGGITVGVGMEDVDSPEVVDAIAADGDSATWLVGFKSGIAALSIGIRTDNEPPKWSDPVLDKLDYYLGLPEIFPNVELSYSGITHG